MADRRPRGLPLSRRSFSTLLLAGPMLAPTVAPAAGGASTTFVALTIAARTNALLEAGGRAIRRRGETRGGWRLIPMPPDAKGQITAVAASADGAALYIAGPEMGIWSAAASGDHWIERHYGLPSRNVTTLAAHSSLARALYAYVPKYGIYRSQDAGGAWRLMDAGPPEGILQLIHSDMPGSMQTGWLFAATAKGVQRIMDCFCLWQSAGKFASGAERLAFNPKQPRHLVVATKASLFRSVDGGETWTEIVRPTSDIGGLAFDRDGRLYAMTSAGSLFQSEDEGSAWTRANV